jgi:hypothetical protein
MHELKGGVSLIGADNNSRILPRLAKHRRVSADLQVLVVIGTVRATMLWLQYVSQIPNLTMRFR